MPDYYAVLQVAPAADLEVIEAAYRRLARKFHPDTSTDPEAPVRIRELNEAYEVLRDPVRRRAYDAERAGRQPISPPARLPGGLLAAAGVILGLLLLARLGRAGVLLALVVGAGWYWWKRASVR